MKYNNCVFLFCSVIFMTMISSSQAAPSLLRRNFIKDELLVKFKPITSVSVQSESIGKRGGKAIKRLNNRGLTHIKIPRNKTIDQAMADFKKDPEVEYVQPNYIYKISSIPNDPLYSKLWGVKNSGQTITNSSLGGPDSAVSMNNPGSSGKDMKMESAWSTITDCSSAIVAVIDTGVNYNHNDLADNMWNGNANHGYDFVDNDNNPMDLHGHGTHVAGTIGARGDNALGTTGVCWRASIMAVRVLDAVGSGSSASVIAGIEYAANNGAKVLNMSLGGSDFAQLESDAVTYARSKGALVVAAAGNDNTNNDTAVPTYPCNFTQDNILCVAALTQNYSLATFSNYGSTSVDVGAPGVNIVSEWPGTSSTLTDSLTSGWTLPSGWGYKNLNFGSQSVACLVNPANYDYNSATYANSVNSTAWKTFNLSGKASSFLEFYLMRDIDGLDNLKIKASSAAGDPSGAGTTLEQFNDSSNGYSEYFGYDLTPFINSSTTTVGFHFTSDASIVDLGMNISNFSITSLTLNSSTYNVISGTSMATPHVAGLATMLFAYNPDFTYSDVVTAIKNSGDSVSALSGKTTTGKAVNATNALAYIKAPTGGAAVKLP